MIERRALDTFCCAGGATRGYQQAGFRVTGVDIDPQPHYCGDEFIQADALEVLGDREFLAGFDFIHASPPCQDHMRSPMPTQSAHGTGWLLTATRELLIASGLPWIIENVPGAPMRADYKLCGCIFGLRTERWQLVRERWFETSWGGFDLRSPCHHTAKALTVSGHTGRLSRRDGEQGTVADWREVMGIDWTSRDELAQAIPPAYTEYLGRQLLAALEGAA